MATPRRRLYETEYGTWDESRAPVGVIYARYSPGGRQGEQSIEAQLKEAYKHAEKLGVRIVGEYVDRKITGRTENRQNLQRLMKDSGTGLFNVVITWKSDRMFRNRYDAAIHKKKLKDNGVKIMYVETTIPDGPEGIILESVIEGMDEYYSVNLSENVCRGIDNAAENCQTLGGIPPLGYRRGTDKKYHIEPETAAVVRMIYNMYDQGIPIVDINDYLNSKGYKTSLGREFTKSSLRTILSSEKYIGVYEAAGIRIEGGVPAIIEKEQWQRIQERVKMNKKRGGARHARVNYLLSGKAYCGKCEAVFGGEFGKSRTGDKHYYYKCTKRKREHACDFPTVYKEWLEQLVVEETVDYILDPDRMKIIASKCAEIHQKDIARNDELAALEGRYKEAEKTLGNIMSAIEQGVVTKTTKARLKEAESNLDSLADEIEVCRRRQPTLTEKQIIFMLEQFRQGMPNDTEEDYRRRLIDGFVSSVHVYMDKVIIAYNLTNEKAELESSARQFLTSLPEEMERWQNEVRQLPVLVEMTGIEPVSRKKAA